MDRNEKVFRCMQGKLQTRAEPEGPKTIEGYFAVFNQETELAPGIYEELAPTAFDGALESDIRALINHDTTLVLGRNKANTLFLKVDETGLYGSIVINENDSDAMNLYERVKRGDVTQCSFGFFIKEESEEQKTDGSWKWIIKSTELFEVSVCTFPAYEVTQVQARTRDRDSLQERTLKVWREQKKERLKHGIKTNHD